MRVRKSAFKSFLFFAGAVMATTSNPWSVAEGEQFQSLMLTSLLNHCPFKGFKCALCLVKLPKRRCSNHSEDPKRLPSRRVLKAAGKTETSIRDSPSPERVPAYSYPTLMMVCTVQIWKFDNIQEMGRKKVNPWGNR